jgi:hypothetical protein
MTYEFSDIDATDIHGRIGQPRDFFTLFDFSAKWDIVPTMLCQSHEQVVRGFMGQTTAFRSALVKAGVTVMGENKAQGTVKYIHGEFGWANGPSMEGMIPEDYQHMVGDPPTDLALHPNSAGYRLDPEQHPLPRRPEEEAKDLMRSQRVSLPSQRPLNGPHQDHLRCR